MKVILLVLMCIAAPFAMGQSGGGFDLQQNVIGNGGWRSDGGGFTVFGTMGQANSGSPAAGGEFNLIDGLWAIENTTAGESTASVSGRVTNTIGIGVPRVSIVLTSPTTNLRLVTRTSSLGYYSISGIPIGGNYVLTLRHKTLEFTPSEISLFISQDRQNVDFVSTQ